LHELSLAEELVARCAERAGGRQVVEVRARASTGVDSVELLAAFPVAAAGAAGGVLEGASLDLEVVPARLTCPCGWTGELPTDNVAGHIGICPDCGRAGEASGGLDLLGLRFAGEAK
jgi:Zn finger protein HypA/HybF involved in hydrogenase expression